MPDIVIGSYEVSLTVYPTIGSTFFVRFNVEAYSPKELNDAIDAFVEDHLTNVESYKVEKII